MMDFNIQNMNFNQQKNIDKINDNNGDNHSKQKRILNTNQGAIRFKIKKLNDDNNNQKQTDDNNKLN